MGVVANPNRERDFDGRVYLKRVSQQHTAAQASRNSRFSVDVNINECLTRGAWREIVDLNCSCGENMESIVSTYDLDEFVANRLCLYYVTYSGNNFQNKKYVNLTTDVMMDALGTRTDQDGVQHQMTLDDIKICVMIKKGNVYEKDCSCDSDFMMKWMPEVGRALRKSYHWLGDEEKIYLVMDNAGGHGTVDCKQLYTDALQEYNVEIVWQVPRSPETNLLDLGIWMSIQSAVTRVHQLRRCQADALAKSVKEAWEKNLSETAFTNVFNKLVVVLKSIVQDEGGNAFVEENRGKLFRDANIIDLTISSNDDEIFPLKNNWSNQNEITIVEEDETDEEMIE